MNITMESKTFVKILLTGLILMGWSASSLAHHPTITAEAVCDSTTGNAVIDYTSTSWSSSPGEGENSQIDILINNVTVQSGAYADPVYSFSGSAPLPTVTAGDIVTVTALAVADWGNGATGNQSESVAVTVPSLDCVPRFGISIRSARM